MLSWEAWKCQWQTLGEKLESQDQVLQVCFLLFIPVVFIQLEIQLVLFCCTDYVQQSTGYEHEDLWCRKEIWKIRKAFDYKPSKHILSFLYVQVRFINFEL